MSSSSKTINKLQIKIKQFNNKKTNFQCNIDILQILQPNYDEEQASIEKVEIPRVKTGLC